MNTQTTETTMNRTKLAETFDLSESQAGLLYRAINWRSLPYGDPSLPEGLLGDGAPRSDAAIVDERLRLADYLIGGHGVETVYPCVDNRYDTEADPLGHYVNMGDSYAATIVFDCSADCFRVTDWATFQESAQSAYDADRDQELVDELEDGADPEAFGTPDSWERWFKAGSPDALQRLPQAMIRDCSSQGDVSESVAYWVKRIGLDAPPWMLRDYLRREVGAWEAYGSHRTNVERLAHLWCCNAKEAEQWGDPDPFYRLSV